MSSEILKLIMAQGAWAVLFVYLLVYVLRENSRREDRYIEVIDRLTENFNIVTDIHKEVIEVKRKIEEVTK